MSDDDYFVCPNCGVELSIGATFCPECGSNDEAGWNLEEEYEDDFDYDEFVKREFPDSDGLLTNPGSWKTWVILLLCLALILPFLLVLF